VDAPRSIDLLLRLEWLALAAVAIVAYNFVGGGWLMFLLLILAPDLSMLAYLAGPRVGAFGYNLAHTLVWPFALIVAGVVLDDDLTTALAAIWIVHIAVDRALGYGLKLPGGFQETHLGRIGRRR
jgi:hypothetical protein